MTQYVVSTIMHVLHDRKGVTALEYAIIAAAIVIAVTAAVAGFGPGLLAKFTALSA